MHYGKGENMSNSTNGTLVKPLDTWQAPHEHYLKALNDPWYKMLVLFQDAFHRATTLFWMKHDVKNIYLPVTTGSISSPMGLGSDSSPVKVNLQGVDTYLADSMQFSLEYGCRFAENGCYYVMPSFRGEDCDKTHLSQFIHSEAEVPGDLNKIMQLVEDYLRFLSLYMYENLKKEIELIAGDTEHIMKVILRSTAIDRISFDEAEYKLRFDEDCITKAPGQNWRNLTRKGEQKLMDSYGGFVWVTHWDEMTVPFYQASIISEGKRRLALNGDLLFGIGETVGAGQRHQNTSHLLEALQRHQVDPVSYDWYIKMRDEAPMLTSGFGMGVERFFMWLLKQSDIRNFQLLLRENGLNILP